MSFSLYYTAKRGEPLTKQEERLSQEIMERYGSQYPFKEKAEDFGRYEITDEPDVIFSGAAKLWDPEPETTVDVAEYWLKCLTELTQVLKDAAWEVSFEEFDLIFDPKEGWRFPTEKCESVT